MFPKQSAERTRNLYGEDAELKRASKITLMRQSLLRVTFVSSSGSRVSLGWRVEAKRRWFANPASK
jgi:hypothetical protein